MLHSLALPLLRFIKRHMPMPLTPLRADAARASSFSKEAADDRKCMTNLSISAPVGVGRCDDVTIGFGGCTGARKLSINILTSKTLCRKNLKDLSTSLLITFVARHLSSIFLPSQALNDKLSPPSQCQHASAGYLQPLITSRFRSSNFVTMLSRQCVKANASAQPSAAQRKPR